MKKNFHKNKYQTGYTKWQAGMTLVELMVVLAIFMIVAGLTIFDYGRFRSNVSLQNLGDDIALSVRRAQNYAIGVHNVNSVTCSGSASSFCGGYGIHFTTNPPVTSPLAGSNKSFAIFADIDNSKSYNYNSGSTSSLCNNSTVSSGNECVDLLNIISADQIYQICPGGINCASGSIDIIFNRPNPDAFIYLNGSGSPISDSSIDIKIQNIQSGNTKIIRVSNTGQISIQ